MLHEKPDNIPIAVSLLQKSSSKLNKMILNNVKAFLLQPQKVETGILFDLYYMEVYKASINKIYMFV